MDRQDDFAHVICDHLSRQKFLTFQRFQRTTIPVVLKKYGIVVLGQLIYRDVKDSRGQGITINDKKEGIWVYWHPNGHMLSKGRYVNGEKNGLWVSWYSSDQIYLRVYYIDGKPSGFWEKWYEDGRIYEQLLYHKGILI